MMINFPDEYLLNKQQIERGTSFDRAAFFESLRTTLDRIGFREHRDFHLGHEGVNEGLCIFEDGEFWVVSYLERGMKISPAFFVDPIDASIFFEGKLASRRQIRPSQFASTAPQNSGRSNAAY